MPQLRKLNEEEVQALQGKGKGVRKVTEERYDRAFADFEAGDYGELTPDEDENRLTARNRLKAAAARRGMTLTFMRSTGETMRFRVDGEAQTSGQIIEPEPEPEPEPVAPPKKRPGRPKKQTS